MINHSKLILGLTLALVSSASLASGGFSAPSGGGEQMYNLGKKVMHKSLLCDECPLAGHSLDKEKAMQMVEKLNNKDKMFSDLNRKESKAVVHYLNKRYSL